MGADVLSCRTRRQRNYILAPAAAATGMAAACSTSLHPMVPSWPAREPAHHQLHEPQEDARTSSVTDARLASTESQRLNHQHRAYKRACGGHLVHPAAELHLQHVSKVMDAGCGTGIWLRDLRASGMLKARAELHGCDINLDTAQGETQEGRADIVLFEHNVLDDFAQGTRAVTHPKVVVQPGSYDLVHARLLVYALDKDIGWQRAVNNMVGLLST